MGAVSEKNDPADLGGQDEVVSCQKLVEKVDQRLFARASVAPGAEIISGCTEQFAACVAPGMGQFSAFKLLVDFHITLLLAAIGPVKGI
jgi:hypothetical protein